MNNLRSDIRHDFEYSIKTFSPSENLCGGLLSEYDVMKAHVLFNQVSFHTDKALLQLRFVESIVVDN